MAVRINLKELIETPSDVKAEFVDKYLENVSSKIKNNPAFLTELETGLKMVTAIVGEYEEEEEIPTPKLLISDDGNTFILRGGFRKSPLILDPDYKNLYFDQVMFNVGANDSLEVSVQMGTKYDAEQYREKNQNGNSSRLTNNDLKNPNIFSVFDIDFTRKVFSSEGIQLELINYDDVAPVFTRYYDEYDLLTQADARIPKTWDMDLIPTINTAYSPTVKMAYRMPDNYAIARYITKDGNNGKPTYGVYQVKNEYPEKLAFASNNPLFNVEYGRVEITPYAHKIFPDATTPEIFELKAAEYFYENLRYSKTAISNPKLVNIIGNHVEEAIDRIKSEQRIV